MRRPEESDTSRDDEFASFVVASRPRLMRLAYLVCGDRHRAEDIVQTVLTKMYVRWARIRRNEGSEPYARRAVVNAAIDERRRPWRREHPVRELPEVPEAVQQSMDSPVVTALMSLPARQRAVVTLRYVEDLDVAQTAAIIGISQGTVKSQAAKGLAALRERLLSPVAATVQGDER